GAQRSSRPFGQCDQAAGRAELRRTAFQRLPLRQRFAWHVSAAHNASRQSAPETGRGRNLPGSGGVNPAQARLPASAPARIRGVASEARIAGYSMNPRSVLSYSPMRGNSVGISPDGTPNHVASVAAYWSTPVVGMIWP